VKHYLIITLILMGFTLLIGSTGTGDKYKILNTLKNESMLRNPKIQFKVSFNDRDLVGNLSGKLTSDIRNNFKAIAIIFLNDNKLLFGFRELEEEYIQIKLSTDRHGMMHLTLQQVYNEVPVLHHTIMVHTSVDGSISGISSKYLPNINISVLPAIDENEAVGFAKVEFGVQNAAYKDVPLIIIDTESGPKLAYDVSVGNFAQARRYIINALDGSVIKTYELIFEGGPVVGKGINVLGVAIDSLYIYEDSTFEREDVNDIVAYWNGREENPARLPLTGKYNMVDVSDTTLGRIYTLTVNNTGFSVIDFVSSDTDSFQFTHRSGVSAHDYHRKTLKYFKIQHDRNGLDDAGIRVIGFVDYGPNSFISVENAFFNSFTQSLLYGDGNGSPFSAALDVIAHEMTHSFTNNSSNLVYANQSGAMNESMSDIFGYLAEAYYQDGGDWLIGEDVIPGGIRDMSHPPNFRDPDNINSVSFIPVTDNPNGSNDQGGVHTNSGIPNKVFYLLVTGATHYGIEVTALSPDLDSSRALTANIWYTWNNDYLAPDDDFLIGREKMLMVSSALYPGNSDYYGSVFAAWASVGVQGELDISLSSKYVIPDSGETMIVVRNNNKGELDSTMLAQVLETETANVESFELNLVSQAEDSVDEWNGILRPGMSESNYIVSLESNNSNIGFLQKYYDIVSFTSIGPVVYDSHEIIFVNNSILFFDLDLRNEGSVSPALNVSGIISSEDTCITDINFDRFRYGEIAAGDTVTSGGRYSFDLNQNCGIGRSILIDLNIFTNNTFFWTDTFSIQLVPVSVEDEKPVSPEKFVLHNNYPNPFNPQTTLSYTVPRSGDVSLKIYNILGEEIISLFNEFKPAGNYEITWDASAHSSGIYFFRLKSEDFEQTKKMVLLK